MEKLTDAQILAADAILEMCNINGTATPFHILGKSNSNRWGLEIDKICDAADFLLDAEVIKLTSENKEGRHEYMFTITGEKEYQKGKRTIDYLNELIEHEAKQHAKEERDEKTKDAQLEKLMAELTVLKDMQKEQRMFWKSGMERDERQKWQFRWTLLLAAAGFILGIINLVRSIILPK
jgi:hypothetical protein